MMRFNFWKEKGTSSLPLLPVPLWPRMVVPIRVLSMGWIDVFEIYTYLIGQLEKETLEKPTTQKGK